MNKNNIPSRHIDLPVRDLVDFSLKRKECILSSNKILIVNTGKRTGRSPSDRFIVEDSITEKQVSWDSDNNQKISEKVFDKLWKKVHGYLEKKEVFVRHVKIGASEKHYLPIKIITELAWHNIFASYLFIKNNNIINEKKDTWTILHAANFSTIPTIDKVNSDGCVIISIKQKKVLIAGIHYAGEIKKSMFTVLSFLSPDFNVLPMHCSSNKHTNGDVTLFFGLSGTGKTTLSSDPTKYLIGDDEHGWGQDELFNFEGGCYAKCINLSKKNEPIIWNAIKEYSVMENVILDNKGFPNFYDNKLTENTRVAYPRDNIDMRVIDNKVNYSPKYIIFLTCDLYGVFPPVSVLTKEQAVYHFLSGYTSKIGGTENNVKNIQSTFSVCFGAPFFIRYAAVYSDLLIKKIIKNNTKIYLVNTGWFGGSYFNNSERLSIPFTREIIYHIQEDKIKRNNLDFIPGFNLFIPKKIGKYDSYCLNPEKSWKNNNEYKKNVNILVKKFQENFKKFDVDKKILKNSPQNI